MTVKRSHIGPSVKRKAGWHNPLDSSWIPRG